MQLRSDAFAHGHPIPKKFTGEGTDVSPALQWSGVPHGTKGLVLICDDPDAPREQTWVHWVAYNIPPDVTHLPEGVHMSDRPKELNGGLQGKTDFGKIGHDESCFVLNASLTLILLVDMVDQCRRKDTVFITTTFV
jgi:Raf kinase inhibitor-like YbhB/YbcL family protein